MRSLLIAILLTGAALAGACDKDSKPPPDLDSAVQLSEAREMFNAKCARCHGSTGAVNGFSSSILRPRPHNYTDPAWQASVTDDQIKEVILRGGVNLGKSPAMPSFPTLRNRPELLNGLVKLIRGFGKRP
jgi:mono/diheme cytochrome c family protein